MKRRILFIKNYHVNIKIINIYNSNLENINTVLTFSNGGKYPGDVNIVDDTIYYVVYNAESEEKDVDLYKYSNGVSSKLIDTDGIYNIRHIGDTLYYIKNSSVYK